MSDEKKYKDLQGQRILAKLEDKTVEAYVGETSPNGEYVKLHTEMGGRPLIRWFKDVEILDELERGPYDFYPVQDISTKAASKAKETAQTVSEHSIRRLDESRMEGMVSDVRIRARDIWGLDYGDESAGYWPAGNQIGRRKTCPEDYGLESWYFRATGKEHQELIQWPIDKDIFGIYTGLAINKEAAKLIRGFRIHLNGTMLPYMAVGPEWLVNGDYLMHYFGMPIGLQPCATMQVEAYFQEVVEYNTEFQFMLLGEIMGKRPYLIRSPPSILEDKRLIEAKEGLSSDERKKLIDEYRKKKAEAGKKQSAEQAAKKPEGQPPRGEKAQLY